MENILLLKFKTQKINFLLNVTFIIFALTFLVDSGIYRFCIYLAALLWLIEGRLVEKALYIYKRKVFFLYFLTLLLFFISLTFFSQNIDQGFWDDKYSNGYSYILNKPFMYILMGLFISTSLNKTFLKPIIIAFVLQAFLISVFLFLYGKGYLFHNFGLHTNVTAILMILSISACIFLLNQTNINYQKAILYLTIVFLFIALLTTASRIGLITIIFFIIYLFFSQKKVSKFKLLLVPVISFILITLFYFQSSLLNKKLNKVYDNLENMNYSSSFGVRLAFYSTSLTLLTSNSKNFLLGLGMGDSKAKIHSYLKKNNLDIKAITKHKHVHNQYLQTWIDGGILSLFIYILIFFILFRININFSFNTLKNLTLISFILFGLTTSFYNNPNYLGLLGFILGILTSNDNLSFGEDID